MSTFDLKSGKTAEKMSDLVMEYVAQFIARDFVEVYEKHNEPENTEFVPSEFDDKIYKKSAGIIKKSMRRRGKILRRALCLVLIPICVVCVAFTVAVLLNGEFRDEILRAFFPFVFR